MKPERTAQECAEIFVTALRQGQALNRQDVLEQGLLSGHDADRALKALRAAGRIRRSAGTEPRAVRYELADVSLGAPHPASVRPGKPRKVCFEALLAAWRIRVPPATPQPAWMTGHLNDAFVQEERRELAALAQEGKRATRRRTR